MRPMNPSSSAKSAQMSRVRRHDTGAELAIRRVLWSRGLRYRVHTSIPEIGRSRPDITFSRARVAVFVDGCFWHRCPDHGTMPKTNAAWWREKLEKNVRRDRSVDNALKQAGWEVIRIWEHEDPAVGASRVEAVVRSRLA